MNKKAVRKFLDGFDWYVVGLSSGKDSTALLIYLLKVLKVDPAKLICTFADTDNEVQPVYDQIDLISRKLHPVIWLKPERGFYDLAFHKKIFPHKKKRFCTEHLKLIPSTLFMNTLEGKILSFSGVRADESEERAEYRQFAGVFETFHGYTEFRPLLYWNLERVFAIHKRFNFPINPLYGLGFTRVGCCPCIFSSKRDIRLTAKHFPGQITRIRHAENNFPNRNGFYQFFPVRTTPPRYRSRRIETVDGRFIWVATVDDVVAWSKTTDFKQKSQFNFHFEDYEPGIESQCQAGVCE